MDILLIIFISLVLIVAAAFDVRIHKIPNLLTYPTMAAALIYYFLITGMDGVLFSLKGLALGIALLIVPYSMGVMGAGDAKLMGAVGAVLGAEGVFIAAVYTAILGGLYAIILLLVNPEYLKDFLNRHATTVKTLIFTGRLIPIPATEPDSEPKLYYGTAIAGGTFVYILLSYLDVTL